MSIHSDAVQMFNTSISSCLDSPLSIMSPMCFEQATASSPSSKSTTPTAALKHRKVSISSIIRKLGSAEIIYDYEAKLGNCILAHSFKLKSKIDLFENRHLIENAIFYWKQMNCLLRAKIMTISENGNENDDSQQSSEKYFVHADDYKIYSCDNLTMYTLRTDSCDEDGEALEQHWRLLYDLEYNKPFVDTVNGLLWRLAFVQSEEKCAETEHTYWMIFTVHHAIADARHVYSLVEQLLQIIEDIHLNRFNFKQTNQLELSIEEKLFKDSPSELYKIKNLDTDNFTDFNKIPDAFKRMPYSEKNVEKFENIWFINDTNDEHLSVSELHEQSQTKFFTKTNGFVIDTDKFSQLLSRCKQMGAKLTGCLNVITAMATFKLYKGLVPNESEFYDIIQYHCLVNLRPFLHPPLDNLTSGYWAVVFNCDLNTKHLCEIDSEIFWQSVKRESDSIHTRIANNEHFECAKLDTALLIDIQNEFQNGSTHFALSNLGCMTSEPKELINITQHYFGTSCQAKRWTSLVFHGLSTIDKQLCWSVTYNSELIRDEIIQSLVKNINEIIDQVIRF